jgi:hypothetical protein
MIGRLRMTVIDLELTPGTQQVVVGAAQPQTASPVALPEARRRSGWWFGCGCDDAQETR